MNKQRGLFYDKYTNTKEGREGQREGGNKRGRKEGGKEMGRRGSKEDREKALESIQRPKTQMSGMGSSPLGGDSAFGLGIVPRTLGSDCSVSGV